MTFSFLLAALIVFQHQIDVLLRAGLVSYNTVVIEITDDREIDTMHYHYYIFDFAPAAKGGGEGYEE